MFITACARKFLTAYWIENPGKRLECKKKYGFDPILQEKMYWEKGIAEKDHLLTLHLIKENNNVFNLHLARMWSKQEDLQNSSKESNLHKHLKGGWKTVRKTDPVLWENILHKVQKEPGVWSAWKAKRAIDLYKKMGGRYFNEKTFD